MLTSASSFSDIFLGVINGLSFLMLLLALSISISRTVLGMIRLYQFQSYILAIVIILNAFDPSYNWTHVAVAMFVPIPIILAIFIRPLLAQATVPENIPFPERLKRLYRFHAPTLTRSMPIWLERRPPHGYEMFSLAFDLALIVASFLTAFTLLPADAAARTNGLVAALAPAIGLAVSLSLLLLGLSIMSNKQDLISQIMGLLVMEHGLFLAAVQVFALQSLVILWVVLSLFLYVIITLTILIFLLPELHHMSGSIEVNEQKQLKG